MQGDGEINALFSGIKGAPITPGGPHHIMDDELHHVTALLINKFGTIKNIPFWRCICILHIKLIAKAMSTEIVEAR